MSVADAMRQLTRQANERSIPLVDDSNGGAQQGRALSPSPRGDTMRWRSQTPEAERRSKQRQQQEYRAALQAQIEEKRRRQSESADASPRPRRETRGSAAPPRTTLHEVLRVCTRFCEHRTSFTES